MPCSATYKNGEPCTREAQIRVRRHGVIDWRYGCNMHLNQLIRKTMRFESPLMIEVGCLQ